jgi:hypothetical protein
MKRLGAGERSIWCYARTNGPGWEDPGAVYVSRVNALGRYHGRGVRLLNRAEGLAHLLGSAAARGGPEHSHRVMG